MTMAAIEPASRKNTRPMISRFRLREDKVEFSLGWKVW